MTAQAAYMWSQDDWGDANRKQGGTGPRIWGPPRRQNREKKKTRALPRKGTEGDDRRLGENLPLKKQQQHQSGNTSRVRLRVGGGSFRLSRVTDSRGITFALFPRAQEVLRSL